MSSFGVLPTGFLQKTLEDILSDMQDAEKGTISNSLNTTATSAIGQINSIVAAGIAELWQVSTAIHASQSLDGASGAQLDNIGSIVDTVRLPSTKSTVSLILNIDDGTIVPTGSIVSAGNNGVRFVTVQDADNTAGAAPANITVQAESFEFGPIIANAGALNTIQTAVGGWTANAGITSGIAETYSLIDGQTLTVLVDGGAAQTATFNTADFADINNATAAEIAAVIQTDIAGVTAFDAAGSVRIESDTEGPGTAIQVTGGTANGALGFDTTAITAMNQLDATLGTNLETNAAFRARIRKLLAGAGAGTLDAIRSAVLQVPRVNNAFVLENPTNGSLPAPLNNLPPHSVEVVVDDSFASPTEEAENDLNIAQTIFDTKAAGIETHGEAPNDVTQIITNSAGFNHTIRFTRTSDEEVYVEATVRVDVDAFIDANDAKDKIATAIAAEGNKLTIGETAIYNRMRCAPFEITGAIDVTAFTIDVTPSPTATADLAPTDLRARLVFDTSRVTVTTIPGLF